MLRIPILYAMAIGLGCTPGAERGDTIPQAAAGEGRVQTGTVRIVGSAPLNVRVVLQAPGGMQIGLSGDLVGELQRLEGAQVAVTGRFVASEDPLVGRSMEVDHYEVVSIDGRPVIVGEVVAIDGESARLRTAEGEEVLVSGVPAGFRVGQKVWVQGPRSVIVQSYGTVRP